MVPIPITWHSPPPFPDNNLPLFSLPALREGPFKIEDNIKKEDDLIYENNLKNEDNPKYEDKLKSEENLNIIDEDNFLGKDN